MRPPEQDVNLVLYQLDCKATDSSSGDTPYMWILGFKVDADTIGPPPVGSLLPTLGVKVFEGAPASPFLIGSNTVDAPATIKIPPALGTRGFRLRPALLVTGDWFSGLAGVVAMLWAQDLFSPSTSEAGFNVFKKSFGPALSSELTNLINGSYDTQLSQDDKGNVVSPPDPNAPLQWRLDRLANAVARANAVKAITGNVKDQIGGAIKDALRSAAGWDELIDPDDLLGVDAQVYLGQELSSTMLDFSLDFTDNDANYTARGHASGSRIRLTRLDSAVTSMVKTFDGMTGLWLRVCWFPAKEYFALAFKVQLTTRFELLNLAAEAPSAVRWFLDDKPLLGQGTVTVNFESAGKFFGPPQTALASKYPGGNSPLSFKVNGSVLEISNVGGEGIFFGTVTALYAYSGDPSIFPSPDPPLNQLQKLCYQQQSELSVMAVELTMDGAYKNDVAQCARIIHEIDRKHIAVNFGKAVVDLGDPPATRQTIVERATADARVANAVGLVNVNAPQKTNIG